MTNSFKMSFVELLRSARSWSAAGTNPCNTFDEREIYIYRERAAAREQRRKNVRTIANLKIRLSFEYSIFNIQFLIDTGTYLVPLCKEPLRIATCLPVAVSDADVVAADEGYRV